MEMSFPTRGSRPHLAGAEESALRGPGAESPQQHPRVGCSGWRTAREKGKAGWVTGPK